MEVFFVTSTSTIISQSTSLVPEESGKSISQLPHPHTGRNGHIPNPPGIYMCQGGIVDNASMLQGLRQGIGG